MKPGEETDERELDKRDDSHDSLSPFRNCNHRVHNTWVVKKEKQQGFTTACLSPAETAHSRPALEESPQPGFALSLSFPGWRTFELH